MLSLCAYVCLRVCCLYSVCGQ